MSLIAAEDLDATALEQVEAIYRGAFEARLRAPFSNLLADQVYAFVAEHNTGPGIAAAAGVPQGFAVLRTLGPTGWVFLRYLAVDGQVRGQGVGGVFWAQLAQAMSATGHSRIVWDVEDPDEPGIDELEAALRRRRIAFYTRLKGQLLPVREYRTPGGTDGDPMRLMAAFLDPSEDQPIVGDDLRQVITSTYRYRYDLDETHPIVARTLQQSGLRSFTPGAGAPPDPA